MNKKIKIEGMTCGHCVMHIETALKEVDGVHSVKVNLKGKFAEVQLTKSVENTKLVEAIDEAGYKVVDIEE